MFVQVVFLPGGSEQTAVGEFFVHRFDWIYIYYLYIIIYIILKIYIIYVFFSGIGCISEFTRSDACDRVWKEMLAQGGGGSNRHYPIEEGCGLHYVFNDSVGCGRGMYLRGYVGHVIRETDHKWHSSVVAGFLTDADNDNGDHVKFSTANTRGHLVSREELEAVGHAFGCNALVKFAGCCVAWSSQGKEFNNCFENAEKYIQSRAN